MTDKQKEIDNKKLKEFIQAALDFNYHLKSKGKDRMSEEEVDRLLSILDDMMERL